MLNFSARNGSLSAQLRSESEIERELSRIRNQKTYFYTNMKIYILIKPAYQKNLLQLSLPYRINGTTSYRTASQSHEKLSELLSLDQLVSARHTAIPYEDMRSNIQLVKHKHIKGQKEDTFSSIPKYKIPRVGGQKNKNRSSGQQETRNLLDLLCNKGTTYNSKIVRMN